MNKQPIDSIKKQAIKEFAEKVKEYINDKVMKDFDDSDSVKYYTIDLDEFESEIDELVEQYIPLCPLSSLPAGQHFLYNNVEFVKLGDEQGGTLCITADIWKQVPFDKDEHNNFAKSSLRDVLITSFLPSLNDSDLCLYKMDLTADNGDRSYGTLFTLAGLLSANLYRKYRDYIPQYNIAIMTCTPAYCGDTVDYIRCVGPGRVLADYCTGFDWGVVPAVIFKKNTQIQLKNS